MQGWGTPRPLQPLNRLNTPRSRTLAGSSPQGKQKMQQKEWGALIILNAHKWGDFFSKKLPINSGSHQPRSGPEVGSGSKSFFVFFIHF